MYVYEHFKLEMSTYGLRGGGPVINDVNWKQGCRIPEVLVSDVMELIVKGLLSKDSEAARNSIFEATISILNLPKGSSVDDVKKLMTPFQNEFYAERTGKPPAPRCVYLHF